jgi:hypothetical protein
MCHPYRSDPALKPVHLSTKLSSNAKWLPYLRKLQRKQECRTIVQIIEVISFKLPVFCADHIGRFGEVWASLSSHSSIAIGKESNTGAALRMGKRGHMMIQKMKKAILFAVFMCFTASAFAQPYHHRRHHRYHHHRHDTVVVIHH